jgi:SPX domain protein involved in polyphosphate accumulation
MERKFLAPRESLHALAARLRIHPARFHRHHPPRRVNNVYFDTREFSHFNDCLDGTSRRKKKRIRWYGSFVKNESPHRMEIKERRGLLGRKISCEVAPLSLETGFGGRDTALLKAVASLPREMAAHLHGTAAVLTNSYEREYFQSADGRFRVTLDRDVAFGRVDAGGGKAVRRHFDRETAILELKYAPEFDDEAARLMQQLPLRLDKHSKYVTGIQHLFGLFVDSPHS